VPDIIICHRQKWLDLGLFALTDHELGLIGDAKEDMIHPPLDLVVIMHKHVAEKSPCDRKCSWKAHSRHM